MSALRALALQLYDLGYTPLPAKDKHPALGKWKQWQTERPSRKQVERWFGGNGYDSVGITTQGLVVPDADCANCALWLKHRLDAMPTTRTPRGFHWWYAAPEGHDVRNLVRVSGKHIDVRANGGFLVVAGPGRRWVQGKLPPRGSDLPVAPASFLAQLMTDGQEVTREDGQRKEHVLAQPPPPQGERNESLKDALWRLVHRGFTRDEYERLAWLLADDIAPDERDKNAALIERTWANKEVGQPLPDDLEPIDGAALLDEVAAYLGRYVAFPSEAARIACALWAAHTHALDCFGATPRLACLSPEWSSGKTRVLECLRPLCPHASLELSPTPPTVFRRLANRRPTFLFDEADTLWSRAGKDEQAAELRALVNEGHRRGATIPRCVGPKQEVQEFPVFAAVAFAGLGKAPDSLMSRSVVINMRRRKGGEEIEPFEFDDAVPPGEELRKRLAWWTQQQAQALGTRPKMPAGVVDRPADVWKPLIAVADAAGGDWPQRARKACVELVTEAARRPPSLGVRLLTDLREVFGDEDALPTTTAKLRLQALEDSPWETLERGTPITSYRLASMLNEFGIKPKPLPRKRTEKQKRGYLRSQFADVWDRYLPDARGDGAEGQLPLEGDR